MYLLDANVISYFLRGVPSVCARLETLQANRQKIHIPVVAYYEIKRGLLAVNATRRIEQFQKAASLFGVLPMTMETYDIASEVYASLRVKGQVIEDADIFIGASASILTGARPPNPSTWCCAGNKQCKASC